MIQLEILIPLWIVGALISFVMWRRFNMKFHGHWEGRNLTIALCLIASYNALIPLGLLWFHAWREQRSYNRFIDFMEKHDQIDFMKWQMDKKYQS